MHTGELYYPNEESIFDEQLKKLDLLYKFNSTRPTEQKRRQALMKEMFAEVGENCWIGEGGSDNARRDDRGQQRYRRGQRRYERYSGECRGLRQSLLRREGDKRARPRVLL
jgi:hypothetical protein